MAKLNIAPTKSNLLVMKEKLQVSKNGYDLLEQKRELLVQELMNLVEKVKMLEDDIDRVTKEAYPAFKQMLMANGSDQIRRISHSVHYEFGMQEKKFAIGGMSFSSLDVQLPKRELFYSYQGTV